MSEFSHAQNQHTALWFLLHKFRVSSTASYSVLHTFAACAVKECLQDIQVTELHSSFKEIFDILSLTYAPDTRRTEKETMRQTYTCEELSECT